MEQQRLLQEDGCAPAGAERVAADTLPLEKNLAGVGTLEERQRLQ